MYYNHPLEKLLKKYDCIYEKEIKLSSGKNSNIYYDIKKAAGIPELFDFIIDELKIIIPKNASIVSVSTGGIPFGAALAYEYKTNFAYVRESKKEYGTNNLIEGYVNYNKPVYIIDDVCTTGNSIIKARNNLSKEYDYNLVCIIDRNCSNLDIMSVSKLNKSHE